MKKTICFLVFLFCLEAFSQNREIRDKIDSLKNEIEAMERFGNLKKIKFEIPPGNEVFHEKDPFLFEDEYKVKTKAVLDSIFSNLTIAYQIQQPYTFATINKLNASQLDKIYGFSTHLLSIEEYLPKYDVIKIHYKDGTSSNYKEVQVTDEKVLREYELTFSDFLFKSVKPIKVIELELHYKDFGLHKYTFDLSHRNWVIEGENVQLSNLLENTAIFTLSPHVRNLIVETQGVYQDGRILRETGSNYSSFPSEEMFNYIKNVIEVYKAAVKKEKKFKNTDEIDHFIKKNINGIPPENENITLQTYYYSGPLKAVNIFVRKKVPSQIKLNVNYSKEHLEQDDLDIKFYEIISNFDNHLFGIVDEKGTTIIEPKYYYISKSLHNNLYKIQLNENDEAQLYWLDFKAKTLNKLDEIELYNAKLYGDFVIVERGVNGKKGLLNVVTGEMLIQPIHENIIFENGYFIIKKGEELHLDYSSVPISYSNGTSIPIRKSEAQIDSRYTGGEENILRMIYNGSGQKIMEIEALYTKVVDDHFYVEYAYEGELRDQDVFDKKGTNLTNKKYYIDGLFSDGLLLVYTQGKDYTTRKNFYIDVKGNVKITVNPLQYIQAAPFSEGRARVTDKNGKNGFIDVSGKLVVPCRYEVVENFNNGYAYVRDVYSNGTGGLIDKNGKMIIIYPQGHHEHYYNNKRKIWTYRLYDDTENKLYDQNGNIIEGPW